MTGKEEIQLTKEDEEALKMYPECERHMVKLTWIRSKKRDALRLNTKAERSLWYRIYTERLFANIRNGRNEYGEAREAADLANEALLEYQKTMKKKDKTDAIRKRGAASVDEEEQAEDGEEVGQENR